MNQVIQYSFDLPNTPSTVALPLTTTVATTPALATDKPAGRVVVLVYSTTEFWVRRGSTVLTNGTDMPLPPGSVFRTSINRGETLSAAATSGTGTLYITVAGTA